MLYKLIINKYIDKYIYIYNIRSIICSYKYIFLTLKFSANLISSLRKSIYYIFNYKLKLNVIFVYISINIIFGKHYD